VPTVTPSPTPNIARPVVPTSGLIIHGRVTNASGAGVGNACVTLGPPIRCWTRTSTGTTANTGYFLINLSEIAAPSGSQWDYYVVQTTCAQYYSGTFVVSGVVQKNATLSGSC
jgi:hypothetical protein